MKRRFVCIFFILLVVYIILSIFIIKNLDKYIYVYYEFFNLFICYGEL